MRKDIQGMGEARLIFGKHGKNLFYNIRCKILTLIERMNMEQNIKDCAAERERRIANHEKRAEAVRVTVMHWKKLAANSYYEFGVSEEIDRAVTDHLADGHGFVYLALMAQLSGKGAEFLESHLVELAGREVDRE